MIFLVPAIVGFVLVFAIHIAAWFRMDLEPLWRLEWVLVALVLVLVAVPFVAVIAGQRGRKKNGGLFEFAPAWVQWGTMVLFVYAMLNFGYFMIREEGSPARGTEGGYVLERKGKVIRTLTAEEFRAQRSFHARFVTGHIMVFSGWAAAGLLSNRRSLRPLPPSQPLHPHVGAR